MEPMTTAPRDRWILVYRSGLWPTWIVAQWWTISGPGLGHNGLIFADWVDQNYRTVSGGTHWAPLPDVGS